MEKDTTIGLEAKEDLLGNMKTFGPLYAGTLQYYKNRHLPIFEIGTTRETEHPYRKGKCLIFRAPFTKTGSYFGLWVQNPHLSPDDNEAIDDLILNAIKVSAKDPDED